MKLKEYLKEDDITDFIDDSKVADDIFKELEIASNDMIMKVIIPKMKSVEDKITKKYKIGKNARMSVDYLGTAYIHDVFRQLLSQGLSVVTSGKRIGFPKRTK